VAGETDGVPAALAALWVSRQDEFWIIAALAYRDNTQLRGSLV